MLKVALASRYDGQEYCVGKFCEQPILITQPVITFEGVFKSTTRSSAGTSTIAEPLPKSSILLTDLILTSDRVALATVTVRFTDGTNNVDIIKRTGFAREVAFRIAEGKVVEEISLSAVHPVRDNEPQGEGDKEGDED